MDLVALIHQCTPPHVSVQTMGKIITVESTGRENAIGYKIVRSDGKVFTLTTQPKDKTEAIAWATWLYQNGFKFDAGPSQINSTNFARLGLTTETVFDICTNIKKGGDILSECYDRAYKQYQNEQIAVRHALSCYQSGNFSTGYYTGYVDKVVKANFSIPANETRKR
ncbi:hypothetical protein GCM10027277_57500 [Pseudoduganella ginsengisoli]|uniref:Transglycosylase SLT domain-containing protein n=1 Tax=Pseudoduganella ginsengisoli TaxID=1462440 RepID=A0A6L6Q8Y0_9BURK|nr:lytic transglycosylase domain-containing protein [Pseudoduganella ginsengisoli]MTW05886.1 transglycosylase SLT domain-containing protein [Pseudoduganella ginsengisoli]